ncbi:hypothetical protein MICCA_170017 [Microcystis aeruginosa PCC 9432]|jgi:hypothetical protein|uniref:Uncharacterized protein n=2 Tax=Microcystis aeruginosa TaxID=1126 RepID=A0A822L5N1_MICAE|nr:hypothetical protein MICCA_170017 [Microcystis aeruginosa PCC 9432]CCI20818.1 hypothetical protein MICAG_1030004 [Microcystis aeruginosa PCC 9808]
MNLPNLIRGVLLKIDVFYFPVMGILRIYQCNNESCISKRIHSFHVHPDGGLMAVSKISSARSERLGITPEHIPIIGSSSK